MIKCPNCGANVNGCCCEYCGTNTEPPKKKGIIESIYDTVAENIGKALNKHKASQEKKEEEKNAAGQENNKF